MKTLFEKIYWTCAIVNAILFAFGLFMAIAELNTTVAIVLTAPFILQVVLIMLYLLVVEVILNGIWGYKIDLFPSSGGDKELKPIDLSKFNVTEKGE